MEREDAEVRRVGVSDLPRNGVGLRSAVHVGIAHHTRPREGRQVGGDIATWSSRRFGSR